MKCNEISGIYSVFIHVFIMNLLKINLDLIVLIDASFNGNLLYLLFIYLLEYIYISYCISLMESICTCIY